MLDPKFIRENESLVRKSLENRNNPADILDKFFNLDKKRREIIQEVELLKNQKKESSKKIGLLIKDGKPADEAKAEGKKTTEDAIMMVMSFVTMSLEVNCTARETEAIIKTEPIIFITNAVPSM